MILVISPKNTYAARKLAAESKSLKIPLKILSISDLARTKFKVSVNKYSCLYIRNPYISVSPKYLPQVIKLAKQFKAAGKKVVDNTIADGNLAQGKWIDYQKLKKARLPIPKTRVLNTIKNPLSTAHFVLKWQFGMGTKNVYLISNPEKFKKVISLHPKKEWMVQELIKADYEYKVITVGYNSLPIVLRFNIKPEGFGIDYYSAKVVKQSLVPKVVKIAEGGARALGRELSKIDILQKGNKFYILEVNRFPGLDSFEELSKFNVAAEFLGYLQKTEI